IKRPNLWRAAFLGGAIALVGLTRAEGVLLYPLLLLPLVVCVRGVSLARRGAMVGAAALVGLLLFGPWVAYNAGRFEHPVLVSTGLGGLLGSSNCPATYHGRLIGGWGFVCLPDTAKIPSGEDESVADLKMRRAGINYARDHASRLPVVIPIRLLRT